MKKHAVLTPSAIPSRVPKAEALEHTVELEKQFAPIQMLQLTPDTMDAGNIIKRRDAVSTTCAIATPFGTHSF